MPKKKTINSYKQCGYPTIVVWCIFLSTALMRQREAGRQEVKRHSWLTSKHPPPLSLHPCRVLGEHNFVLQIRRWCITTRDFWCIVNLQASSFAASGIYIKTNQVWPSQSFSLIGYCSPALGMSSAPFQTVPHLCVRTAFSVIYSVRLVDYLNLNKVLHWRSHWGAITRTFRCRSASEFTYSHGSKSSIPALKTVRKASLWCDVWSLCK